MKSLDDIALLPELQDALRKLSTRQRDGLKESIVTEKKFLNPVLWAMLGDGTCCVVDGHNRIEIWDELRSEDIGEISEPETQEVEELRGCTLDQAIQWVKKHQVNRRNDENLVKLMYEIGTEWNESDKTSAEVGEEYGLTESQVRHAGKLAEVLVEAEEIAPGTTEKILEDKTVSQASIRNSSPQEVAERATHGAPVKGPLSHFEPLTRSLANLRKQAEVASRAIKSAENETTPCAFSEKLAQLSRELISTLDDMDESVKNWQFDGTGE